MIDKLRAKAARTQAGLTQAEVAKRINKSQNTVMDWERGVRQPRQDEAKLYADAIGFDLDDIYFA